MDWAALSRTENRKELFGQAESRPPRRLGYASYGREFSSRFLHPFPTSPSVISKKIFQSEQLCCKKNFEWPYRIALYLQTLLVNCEMLQKI